MIEIVSFGYLHRPGDAVVAEVVVDVRRRFRDPHVLPEFRQLTGKDQAVRDKVLGDPQAESVISSLVVLALAMKTEGEPLTLAVGCAGGRHRSVVVADEVWAALSNLGETVRVQHLDVEEAVVSHGM